MANLCLPVYSGIKIQYGIRSSEFLEKAATLDADQDKEAVILNTIDAFSNLYKAKANLRVIQENLAQSRSRDADFANLEKNGLLARNDKLKALLQTANIELTLADVENNLKVTMVNMNIMLGLPEATILIPDSTSLVEPGSKSPSRNMNSWPCKTERTCRPSDTGNRLRRWEYNLPNPITILQWH